MKVGLLVKSIDHKGGIQRNYKLWFEMFKRKGDDVKLFVLEKFEGEDIIYLDGTLEEKGKKLSKILENEKFDLFLVNAEYLKSFINQPYFITVHNSWKLPLNPFRRFKRYKMLKEKYENEHLIGISNSVLKNITENLKIKVKSTHVVYAPHDIEKVRTLAKEEIEEDNFIVAVGSVIKRKNYDLLVKAFYLIHKKIDENLVIVGDGKERKRLEKLIKKLNLQNRVKILGYQSNPYPYIKRAKLLVNSSTSEGLPRSVVEGLILNTPVVCTYSSEGIDEVMVDKLREFIVFDFRAKSLADKMLKALNEYPTIKEEYYKKFSIEESYKRLKALSTYCETSNTG